MYWFQFIFSSLIIILAGIHLTNHADRLSDQLNIGKAWVGILLLGMITSLPEAITCVVSVVSLHADDLAIGNLMGSNNFNPMLIVLMDLVYRKGSITDSVVPRKSIKTSSFFVIYLSIVVILEILLPNLPYFGPVSVGGVLIVGLYLLGMRKISKLSMQEHKDDQADSEAKTQNGSLTKTWVNVIISAVVVIFSAMVLARSADVIADQTGLGRTFVGSIFLAIVTSLPEMVVTLSALNMGSTDLAIGNIFGSNMTNTFFIVLCSLAKFKSPVLLGVSKTHLLTASMSIVLVVIASIGIEKKKKQKIGSLSWDTWLMTAIFLVGTYFLYTLR